MTDHSEKPASADLDQMLCFAVYRAEQAFNRVYRTALAPMGLTYPQFLTMKLLWSEGSLSVGEISQRLGVDSGTTTPLIKRLSLMGLVTKMRRDDDERRVDISLTEKGRALQEKSDAVTQCIVDAVGMDAAQANETLATINALSTKLSRTPPAV
jgi:DNA-binding MarR family transcriptional regulator